MTGYERELRTTQRVKTESPYSPWRSVRLEQRRGVWRHSRELLLAPAGKSGGEHTWQRPLALRHVADMSHHGHIPRDAVYTLRAVDQVLDSNNSVIRQTLEETVAAPVTLLRADHETAGPIIGYAVTLADDVGKSLVDMERDFFRAFHRALRPKDLAKFSPQLDLFFWPRLRQPFDHYLVRLGEACRPGRRRSPYAGPGPHRCVPSQTKRRGTGPKARLDEADSSWPQASTLSASAPGSPV